MTLSTACAAKSSTRSSGDSWDRDEIVDLIALAVTAGEHLILHGPPGTAKSALIRQFAGAVRGKYFEYLLTRFSEPNEVFGPIDLVRLRKGTVATVTSGMLPEAEFVFLDELFNANSAILNNLLTVLNERIYRRGAEVHRLPLLSLFAASNHLPEDDSLRALFDRFLLRSHVENLKREQLPRLLRAGWELERFCPLESSVTAEDLRELSRRVYEVEIQEVADRYAAMVTKVRDLGVALSDRRVVKVLKLVAASAVLCGRTKAVVSDFWVFRYVWDREEQIAPLRSLVAGVIEHYPVDSDSHPLAALPGRVSGEELARSSTRLRSRCRTTDPSAWPPWRGSRERLTELSDQAAWVNEDAPRTHLIGRVRELLKRLG